ncbi:glycolate oxidase iron-sulfur subunit [Pseudomonas aeruginosa]|nr:glycolate oxidase iron-sulfur subunit [Pseudomonas aeruginosa]
MQTNLCDSARQRAEAAEAERILRSCVHCGFCNATCPTYQELGDELDGPRGRIYLIKQFLERDEASERTRLHLDRCLSCRNCETTCPSGVEYHKLLDIGRDLLAERLPRGFRQRLLRDGLRLLAPRPGLFGVLAGAAGWLRPLLPEAMQGKLPRRVAAPGRRPQPRHARRVLLLEGCVQPALSPNTNAAAARVLDRLGISVTPAAAAGCCGALDFHLDAQERGRPARAAQYRRLVAVVARGCRGHRADRQRLRRLRQGLRLPAARRPTVRGQGARGRRRCPRPGGSASRRAAGIPRPALRPAPGIPLPMHTAARATTGRGRGGGAAATGLPSHRGGRRSSLLRLPPAPTR